MPYLTLAAIGFAISAALVGFLVLCARSPEAEEPHGDVPRVPKPLRTAEPEHSHRSATAGRRVGLGVFAAGNGHHRQRIIGDD